MTLAGEKKCIPITSCGRRVVAAISTVATGAPERFVFHAMPTVGGVGFNVTYNEPNQWMSVDLGEGRALVPDHYCLRSDGYSRHHKLRNWELQGSHDGNSWVTLRQHANDASLQEASMSVAAWPVEHVEDAHLHMTTHQTFSSVLCRRLALFAHHRPHGQHNLVA